MTAQPKLLEQVRNVIRRKHYSYETEKSYVNWIKRFIAFHHMTRLDRWALQKSRHF